MAEWLANGRRLPIDANAITITELIAKYWSHAREYYKKPDGTASGELENINFALRPLKDSYGHTLAAEFGPRALKAVRQLMIDDQQGQCALLCDHAYLREESTADRADV